MLVAPPLRRMIRRMVLTLATFGLLSPLLAEQPPQTPIAQPSFVRDIEPILRTQCQGCHQPAKPQGDYEMTAFDALLAGGESGSAAIVPGKPEESSLIELITPADGVAEMPRGGKPLHEVEIEKIRNWIAAGAVNDSPPASGPIYSADNPPVYSKPPVVPSIDFSPDGSLLAIAGFHEVLLLETADFTQVGRLIGLSERIESVRFSPDGTRLAVAGGLPSRLGEIQVWDVEKRTLLLSRPATFDTVYGVSWSPDGKLIAFGGADTIVRAIDAQTGEQQLFQGAHDDWVRATAFSNDGKHLVSVGRDMTCKLIEVETERFVDNITSITPGALSGGVNSVVMHPSRDEIFVGGADGIAKVYRIFRQTARKIGDDANLLKKLPAMKGRIFSVDISADGTLLAAAATLDGHSEVRIFKYVPEAKFPAAIKAIQAKRITQRSAEEKKKLEDYVSSSIDQVAQVEIPETAVYAIDFSAQGLLAVAGADGLIRLLNPEDGSIAKTFAAVPLSEAASPAAIAAGSPMAWAESRSKKLPAGKPESIPADAKLTGLVASPEKIQLTGPFAYVQLMVQAELANGERVDVTRIADMTLTDPLATLSPGGLLRGSAAGEAELIVRLQDQELRIPVAVADLDSAAPIDFVRDVGPVMSRLGCNQGTCHGAQDGKNGFKLSLRGYDPLFDIRALTDDLAARRVNIASPESSLMLMKTLGLAPHEGGVLVNEGEPYHEIMRRWIAEGARLNLESARVAKIDILPQNPVVQQIGSRQQIRVVATYTDGATRDVTQEAFIESSNTEVATRDITGLMTAVRRGEAAILARFEGAYAATTLTVMGNRDDFVWEQPETWGRIDELVAEKWQRMKIQPSGLCSDEEFVRRIHLDLTGLPPTADQVLAFTGSELPSREKRQQLVDQLIGNDDFVEYWSNKWADLLQVNRKFLGAEGAKLFRDWIQQRVRDNMPYDQFVREIVASSGSNKENPAASYYKILRTPEDTMENTTHLFLGVRFNCNKCHDHPFERWTQDQYYQTSAYFARFALKADPAAGKAKIGGTAVEGAKPLYEVVYEKEDGEIKHERTGAIAPPVFPYACEHPMPETANRREQLAAWITAPDNQYFARSYVNRIWGYLTGVGIIEPIDDIRAGNPPTNPELLDFLTEGFVVSGFDTRHLMRLIANSRTYQLSVETNKWNEDDALNYSHATAKRLPAEVLYDAVHRVTGAESHIPGVPAGTRAAAIPDSGIKLTDGFLANFGRPSRESSCECERSSDLQLGPVMALVSGPTVGAAISDPKNALASIAQQNETPQALVDAIFLRVLNRHAKPGEVEAFETILSEIGADHETLAKTLAEREAWWQEERAKLEQKRLDQLASVEIERSDRIAAMKTERDQLEAARNERIAAATATQKAYVDKLDDHAAAWAQQHGDATSEWFLLEPSGLSASNGATLARQEDRSIVASGKAEKGKYVITVKTKLQGITGFRLEALPQAGVAGGGPGLPGNGNFVVTEFSVQAAAADKPKKLAKLKLKDAKADFTQSGFDPAQAIDGNAGDQKGWAISPAGGTVHWATFATEAPVGHPQGTILTFTLDQVHNAADHRLARFRLSATTDAQVQLGLPEPLLAIQSVASEQRSDEQKKRLRDYFAKIDAKLGELNKAIAAAKAPVPADPVVVSLDKRIAALKQPTPDDPKMLQLRLDLQQSQEQLANERLTATEDLTWALINSPAFLFNR
ncbi:WD domain, G-beta repeat [Rosistilla oblonga]|uniref:DUF1549 domain-containing protein n=1 Tax=Rosistilla oblonga TaxID=2527990 RepID=UPI00118BDB3C|nr:DUF1549 domain-containing protein [Rosistilla oblonga]QDV14554.1 WD domain, G-beta repeat [Rosistilla oblonga]